MNACLKTLIKFNVSHTVYLHVYFYEVNFESVGTSFIRYSITSIVDNCASSVTETGW